MAEWPWREAHKRQPGALSGTANELYGPFLCRGVHSDAAATVSPILPVSNRN
jgi:hypothetical protein